MRIILTAAILQYLLLMEGNKVTAESKIVKCFYFGPSMKDFGTLNPENISSDACTHLVYIPLENYTTGEIYMMPNYSGPSSGNVDVVPALARLTSENPELKLILHLSYMPQKWDLLGSPDRSGTIQDGIDWLRESGFHGVDIPIPHVPEASVNDMVEFICEMKSEFDKYGYEVSVALEEVGADDFPKPIDGQEDVISKLARCCDFISLRKTDYNETVTHHLTPLSTINTNVDSFARRGLPMNKTLITILTMANIVTLVDSNDTGLGAKISGPGDGNSIRGALIPCKDLIEKSRNASLVWNQRRDEKTQELYAFTTSGLWVSIEDVTSVEFKARYVMEKGLRGIEIDNIDFDECRDFETESSLPLTKAIRDAFKGGL